ncbi:MAG: flavin reductase family protein [Actinomycetota bacterium]|nr:flavin reductase family protein [Actinomycetota bacterium]
MDSFDQLIADLDPPMAVVTTAVDGESAGCLIGFHAQSSIEPARYTVWLSKANHTGRVAQRATTLAVHFLDSSQHDLAAHFGTLSGDDVDKFDGVALDRSDDGVPLLRACANRFVGRRVALLDEGGDHLCIVVEPHQAWTEDGFRPLRLSDVSDLTAGHDSEERNTPRTHRADG